MNKLSIGSIVLFTLIGSVHAYHGGWVAVVVVCTIGTFTLCLEVLYQKTSAHRNRLLDTIASLNEMRKRPNPKD